MQTSIVPACVWLIKAAVRSFEDPNQDGAVDSTLELRLASACRLFVQPDDYSHCEVLPEYFSLLPILENSSGTDVVSPDGECKAVASSMRLIEKGPRC